jgi:cytochrome c-type biogenesis protein CcmH/NrfG
MIPSDALFAAGAAGLAAVPVLAIARPLWRDARLAAVWLPLVVLVGTGLVYTALGRPGAWAERVTRQAPTASTQAGIQGDAPSQDVAAPQMGQAQVEAMVQRLSDRLQREPNDPAGWRMLIRSYETLYRFEEAALAWQKLFQLAPPDATQLTEYAVTLGMARGHSLTGEPEQALEQALKLEPGHAQALALLGSASFERHDYIHAIQRWEQLLQKAPLDEGVRERITAQIDKARDLMARDAKRKP